MFVRFGQGELATSGKDVISPDDNAHIMEGGSWPEDAGQEFGAEASVYFDTGFGEAA